MTATGGTSEFPLRSGLPQEFALARDFFKRSDYSDATLCRALGINCMADLDIFNWDEFQMKKLPVPLCWCVRIFLRGQQVDYEESLAICGEETLAAFTSLTLVRRTKKNPSAIVCPVWLYPVDGFVMASDRTVDPDGGSFTFLPDVVYPAITDGTLEFLRLLPEVPGGEALDLCGGSGIGALHLARAARAAATADVTERSARFAEFNALLNGVDIESVCGDLYGAVPGRQFDAITAHPPFVPSTGRNVVFRDGGDTGEAVTRRIVEGLPDQLRVGGTCMIFCIACDSEEKTFEQRARDWLGEKCNEFDVLFGLKKTLSIEEAVQSMRKRPENFGDEEAKNLCQRLRSLGVRQFVYGALFIRRDAGHVTHEPSRIGLAAGGGAADFDRMLTWRHYCRGPAFAEWFAQSRPRLSPHLQLTARHTVQNGQLAVTELVFSVEAKIKAALRTDAWIVPLIAQLEGNKSVREVFDSARKANEMPQDFTLEDFLKLLQLLIERGFLEVEFPR